MDARELTKKYYEMSNTVSELKKQVEYLTQMLEKQQLAIDDMKIDVAMASSGRRV